MHDRVGRMADTWEYRRCAAARALPPDLLRELLCRCAELLELDAGTGAEARLHRAADDAAEHLPAARRPTRARPPSRGYGQAIKDLAAPHLPGSTCWYKNSA